MLSDDTLDGYLSWSDTKEERAEILSYLIKREGITENKPGKLANLFFLIPGLVEGLKTDSGMKKERDVVELIKSVLLRRDFNWIRKNEKDIIAYLDLIVKSPYFGASKVTIKPVKKMIGELEIIIDQLTRG